jgi:hypothetical protein
MTIDLTHRGWMIAMFVLSVVAGILFGAAGPAVNPGIGAGLLFALCGTLMIAFCALLPLRRKLQRVRRLAKWRILRSAAWEKGHIYLGLLACLFLHCHAGFRVGGPLTMVLLGVLWAIILSGVSGLFFRHLLPLVKTARDGKALRAAQIIGTGHTLTLRLHVPLTVTLLGLLLVHVVVSLRY